MDRGRDSITESTSAGMLSRDGAGMSSYLQRMALSAMKPGGSLRPLLGSIFSPPLSGSGMETVEGAGESVAGYQSVARFTPLEASARPETLPGVPGTRPEPAPPSGVHMHSAAPRV